MKLKVNVTANDIKYGVPRRPRACPIRRAIYRTKYGKQFNRLKVGPYNVAFDQVTAFKYVVGSSVPMPEVAVRFVYAFDHRLPVEPFTFELEVPDA